MKPGIGTPAASAAATLTTAVAVPAGGELCSAADCSATDCSVGCSVVDDAAAASAAADGLEAAEAADADAVPGPAVGVTAATDVETGMLVLVLPGLSGAAVVHAVSAIAVAAATSTARIPIALTCLKGGGGYLANVPPGNDGASASSLTVHRGSGNDKGPCTRNPAGQALPDKAFPAPPDGVDHTRRRAPCLPSQ